MKSGGNNSPRENFYRRALARLSPEEREMERSRAIPYEYSLSAVSAFFFETGIRQGWIESDGSPISGLPLSGLPISGSPHGGFKPERPLLLAVSGGSDSMAMLWMFRVFCESRLIAAHFEHGIRGAESAEDASFVEDAARRWGIESAVCRGDVPGSLEKGESVETCARRLRYAFFERLAEERGACGVALGHNREDVAETVLFNLLRGSGVRGLAGMPERRGIFFRPLLACSREFLRGLLRHRGISWREDRTNRDDAYTRNFIRNKLIPAIESGVNARATDHLVAFAEEMRYYRAEEERQGGALIRAALADNEKTGGSESKMEGERCFKCEQCEQCERDFEREWKFSREVVSEMSFRERTVLAREAARRLGIPVLSRERCAGLARLMKGKRRFEFQCSRGAYVLGDGKGLLIWRTLKNTALAK